MMVSYIDPLSGMLARAPNDAQGRLGALLLRPSPPATPCIHCGHLTERRVIGALCEKVKQEGEPVQESNQISPGSIGYRLHPTHWEELAVCEDCEMKRVRVQWQRIAANLECYPHLRAAAIEALGA